MADSRSRRFSENFVRQWLGLQLLDYLDVDRKAYPQFDPSLKEAMQEEPGVFFHNLLQANGSVMDFVHSDYAMINERLAQHYGIEGVEGPEIRRIAIRLARKRIQPAHIIAWSFWRRAHQAAAQRAHFKSKKQL